MFTSSLPSPSLCQDFPLFSSPAAHLKGRVRWNRKLSGDGDKLFATPVSQANEDFVLKNLKGRHGKLTFELIFFTLVQCL